MQSNAPRLRLHLDRNIFSVLFLSSLRSLSVFCLSVMDSRQVSALLCWLTVSFVSPPPPLPHPHSHPPAPTERCSHTQTHAQFPPLPRGTFIPHSEPCLVYLSCRLCQGCELFVLPTFSLVLQAEFFFTWSKWIFCSHCFCPCDCVLLPPS